MSQNASGDNCTVTLRLKRLRTLRLEDDTAPGRQSFISAASGIVPVGKWLYVIADDALHLGVFPATGLAAGSLVRLLPDKLPQGPKERKARKADFEVLTRLPRFPGCPHGALLALGSGSRPRRRRGVLVPLNRVGAIRGSPRVIDLSRLYAGLEDDLVELNVEGALVLGKQLCLLNRGHPRHGGSAAVWLNLRTVLRSIAGSDIIDAVPCMVRRYDLGKVDGVPLGFTDGAALPGGGIVFTAVAESAESSYEDGPCVGAAVGVIGPDGGLNWVRKFRPLRKVEGVAVRPGSRGGQVLLVTDADDANIPAVLYGVSLPRGMIMADKRPSRRSHSPRR